MTVHMIFDVKLDVYFTCKVMLVTDGHKVDNPPSMTYEFVVSRESVRIILIIADINGMDVQCTIMQNSHLNANAKEYV